jgi:hypothetical protein
MRCYKFQQGDNVLIHSIGPDGKTYRARICGLAHDWGDDPATSYIVEMIDSIRDDYKFTHCVMPAACLKYEK